MTEQATIAGGPGYAPPAGSDRRSQLRETLRVWDDFIRQCPMPEITRPLKTQIDLLRSELACRDAIAARGQNAPRQPEPTGERLHADVGGEVTP